MCLVKIDICFTCEIQPEFCRLVMEKSVKGLPKNCIHYIIIKYIIKIIFTCLFLAFKIWLLEDVILCM